MLQQIITPAARPVRRYNKRDLERLERECAYRPMGRQSFGSAPTEQLPAAGALTPASIMGGNCVEWWRADLGNTISVDGNWVGQVTGKTFAQATSGSRPTQSATGGPNSTASMTFDGVDDRLDVTLARPAPGTTPAIIWVILKQVAWVSNKTLISDAGNTMQVMQRTSSPNLALFAGGTIGVLNNAGTVGTWVRLQAYFNNSGTGSDENLIITTSVTGTGTGNLAGTAPILGCNAGSANFANFALAELAFFNAKPAGTQITDLKTYCDGRYGTGLL